MFEEDIFIHEDASIKDALKKLDRTAKKVLLTIDVGKRLLGTITDGDLRRYILSGKSLENNIRDIYNRNPIFIRKKNFSLDSAKEMLVANKVELLPVIDDNSMIVDFITWDQLFSADKSQPSRTAKIDVPVVIMAGGKGARLEPFTRILPKPLIPIDDKPIIEVIMDEFRKHGVSEFYITLNHKGEMIRSYFNSIGAAYKIRFIEEETFLGTAGSLRLLQNRIDGTFIVSNCDVIVRADFADALSFHKEQKACLTVLSSIQHHKIPYGIIKFKDGGEVLDIVEKPEFTLTINAGVYILNRESLDFIPRNLSFDMTDLIKNLVKENKKVAMYPVNEKDYIDVGQWEEYKKSVEKLKTFL